MKEKIAFPQLVELVADKAKTTTRMSELFLQELFATVSHALDNGEIVKIKGIGSFKVKKEGDQKDVFFIPDNDLAETVNAPFIQFKPVELSDEITEEQLAEIDAGMEQKQPEPKMEEPTNVVQEQIPMAEVEDTAEPEVKPIDEPVATDKIVESTPQVKEEPEPLPGKNGFAKWWWIGAAAIAAVALTTLVLRSGKSSENNRQQNITAKTDTVAAKAQPVVTDTLANGNVLTLMAKKHYGDQVFWVYIARENQDKYPNYHKIPHGSVLVIPPPEKYGINSDSKQSLRHAGEEALKLYKKIKAMESNADGEEKDISEEGTKESTKSNGKYNYKTVKPIKKKDAKKYSKSSRSKKSYKRHYRR